MARRLFCLISVVLLVGLVGGVSADEIEWLGTVDTSWGNSNNWDPAQVPGVDDIALFGADATGTDCLVNSNQSIKVLQGPGYRDNAVLDASGVLIGGAPSTLTIDGATLTVTVYAWPAYDANGWGVINVESGGTLDVAQTLYLGNNGIARLNMNGGTVNALSLRVGVGTADSIVNLDSGDINANGIDIGSNGLVDITGGTLNLIDGDFRGSVAGMTYDGGIVAYGGRGRIVSSYTADPCQTVVTAVQDLAVAYDPNIIGDTGVVHDAKLTWKPGDGALSHTVYLSTSFDDVNEAISPADDCFVGNYAIDHNYVDDAFLEFGSTIYWRVDEVGASTVRGNIWHFSTDNGRARNPKPADGTVDVNVIDLELEWDRPPGRIPYSVKYNVYFGEDYDEVNDVEVDNTGVSYCIASNQDANSISRSVVKLDTTYWWRVDTKVIADACTVRGDLWSCTTVNNYDVDNFESYSNKDTLEIYWDDTGGVLDYWDLNMNFPYSGMKCVEIEYWTYDPPYYGGISRTHFPTTLPWNSKAPTWADWRFDGTAEALSLWFSPGADPNLSMGGIDQLYARITDSSSRVALIHYTDNWPVSDFDKGGNQEWNIALQEFKDDNSSIDLTNVKTFEVGFLDGLGTAPAQTGTDFIYFDQIRLYARRCISRYGLPDADLNDDCVVDLDDVKIMAGDWLDCDYSITGVAVDPCDANLVAHWKLDGNALDSGPDGHHGTVVGNPAWDPNGIIDGAMFIPEGGGGYIDCGGGKDPGEPDTWADITGEITVAAWVKPSYDCWWCNLSTVVNKGREVAWDLHKSATNVPGLQQYHRTISFYVDVPEVPWYGIHAKTDLFDLRWHHVAGVYKVYEPGVSSEVKVYTDGGEEGGLVCSGSPIDTSKRDIFIGDTYSLIGWSHPWFGHIDDVRIYDRALDHSEIVGIVKEAPLGPLASYEFESETGGVTPDSSGGHDGTLVNGASIVYDADRDSNVLELNGIDQYVDCGGGHDLNEPNCTDEPANCTWADITGQFTFTAWVKPNISDSGNYRAVVFGKGDDGGYHRDYPSEPNRSREGWSMLRLNSENVVTVAVTSTPANLTPVKGIEPRIDVNIWDGKWHHIAATSNYLLDFVDLYIDGIKATEWSTIWEPKYPSTTNYPIWIGANVGEVLGGGAYADGYHGWKGRIDDVRIYDRALTEFEIANVMGGADVYVPLTSLANLYDEELINNKIINFRDYQILADGWLEDETFPFRD